MGEAELTHCRLADKTSAEDVQSENESCDCCFCGLKESNFFLP